MQDQPAGGSIVMIGSVSGTRPSPGTAAYGAAKAGLHHLATSLAVEWAPRVRVNTVVPGFVATESAAAHYGDAAGLAAVAATVPLRRMATPDDVAADQRRVPHRARRRRTPRLPVGKQRSWITSAPIRGVAIHDDGRTRHPASGPGTEPSEPGAAYSCPKST